MMRPGLENNLSDPSKNLTFLAYTLERAAALSASAGGDGRFVVLIDYAAGEFSLRRAPSLSTSKATLAIIQNHYPERLAASFMCDSPAYFYPTFRLIKPFIDPVTAAKSKKHVAATFVLAHVACSSAHRSDLALPRAISSILATTDIRALHNSTLDQEPHGTNG